MDKVEENQHAVLITTCPHCQKAVEIDLYVHLKASSAEVVIQRKDYLKGMTATQLKLIESARNSGVMKHFEKCVNYAKAGQVPKSIEKFFITVLSTAVPKTLPRFALNRFIQLCGQNVIVEFYASQEIGIVVGSGQIRAFIPCDVVLGKNLNSGGPMHLQHRATEEDLDGWLEDRDVFFTLGQRLNFGSTRSDSHGG